MLHKNIKNITHPLSRLRFIFFHQPAHPRKKIEQQHTIILPRNNIRTPREERRIPRRPSTSRACISGSSWKEESKGGYIRAREGDRAEKCPGEPDSWRPRPHHHRSAWLMQQLSRRSCFNGAVCASPGLRVFFSPIIYLRSKMHFRLRGKFSWALQ